MAPRHLRCFGKFDGSMAVRPSPLRAALLVLAAGACVTPQPTSTTPRPVADDVRAARLALGPVDDVLLPADDPRPRLRALRDLADRLDNENEAAQAALAVVNLSEQRVKLAGAAGEAAARRELATDLDAAIALIERRQMWWALPNLVDIEPDTQKRGAIFLRAIDGGLEYLSNESMELARASARTPREQALLERVDRLDLPPQLDRAALAALGVEFLDVLEARMFDEADRGDLAAAVASAKAVLALDPLHLEARLVLAYDADRRAGRLEHRTRVLRALLLIGDDNEQRVGPQAVAMLEYARHDAPLAGSLVVGEAIALIAAGVPGDAWSLLERTPVTGVGELRDDVRGLLALEAGALATYRLWRDARGGRTSPSVAMRELRFLWREDAPAQHTVAEEAARRTVDAGWPTLRHSWSWGLAETVAKDDKAPRALRERALERVSAGEHVVLRHCVDTSLPAVSCQRLLDAVFTVTDDEGGEMSMREAVAALAGVPGTANLWLANLVWADADTLETLGRNVAVLEGSAPAMTEIWVSVAVRAAIARGDTTEAARLLGAYGSLLTPLGLAASRLAVTDVRADVAPHDVADALAQIAWVRWPIFQMPDRDDEERDFVREDETDDGEGEVHAFATALDVSQRTPEEMAATVAAIRARHPEPELAALDIVVAVALATQDVPASSAICGAAWPMSG